MRDKRRLDVLMADDSHHDIRMTRRILSKIDTCLSFHTVSDGAKCMDYLLRAGDYADSKANPWPGILLLDINMPKLNGFEVLKRIKQDPRLKRLPVIVMTTSSRAEDMLRSYELGANAYVTKPEGMERFSQTLEAMIRFWSIAELPQ